MTHLRHLPDDTICAISTPRGVGGIAVARMSGPAAVDILCRVWRGKDPREWTSHTAHLGEIVDPADHSTLDTVVATLFRGPASFTGDDVVEISMHGSQWIQREMVNLLVRQGCRVAQPGEFTRRAFASGRLDLAEAEGVADVIASSSRAAHRLAVGQMRGRFSEKLRDLRGQLIDLASLLELELDFSEEDVEFASRQRLGDLAKDIQSTLSRLTQTFAAGAAIKEGIPVAIVGATNAGKSTLLNVLVGEEKAIVSDIHGTTRDSIEDTVEIGDALFRFVDTAGLRHTDDTIERIGIERALAAAARARIILWIVDPSAPITSLSAAADIFRTALSPDQTVIAVVNKTDAATTTQMAESEATLRRLMPLAQLVRISALNGQGIDKLKATLMKASGADAAMQGEILVTNARHYEAFLAATDSITRVVEGLATQLPPDLVAQDLRETIHHLAAITGDITTPDLLSTIFSRFCIGK